MRPALVPLLASTNHDVTSKGSFKFCYSSHTVRLTQQPLVVNGLCCQFKDTDKSAPPPNSALVYSHFRSPTKNLTDRIYGVSMLQIFEPFSLFCNAYTGKWSKWRHCVTQQYYTVESRNLILLSLKLQWPSTGCSFSDEVEINIYISRINPVLCWVLFFYLKAFLFGWTPNQLYDTYALHGKVKTLFSKVDTVKIMPLWKSLLFDWRGNVFIIMPLCKGCLFHSLIVLSCFISFL